MEQDFTKDRQIVILMQSDTYIKIIYFYLK